MNAEVWINNVNTGYGNGTVVAGQPSWGPSITGCSGASVSAVVKNNMTACETDRDYKENGVKASTTGNIYGIYDMSGGVWERVLGSTTDVNGNFITSASGFTSAPDPKYLDKYGYNTSNTDYSITKLGDATKEVRKGTSGGAQGWYSDYSYIPYSPSPWFNRGGYAYDGSSAGLFNVYYTAGNAYTYYGSRAMLVSAR